MPFDGSGNFNRVMNWVADAAAAIKIRADRHDQEDDNFAAGLSNCLTKDGQTLPTANIPMNGKKIIGLATPTLATDAVNKAYADAIRDFSTAVTMTGDNSAGSIHFTGTGNLGLRFQQADLSFGVKQTDNPAGTVNRFVWMPTYDYSGTPLMELLESGQLNFPGTASFQVAGTTKWQLTDGWGLLTAPALYVQARVGDPRSELILRDSAATSRARFGVDVSLARTYMEYRDNAGTLQNKIEVGPSAAYLNSGYLSLPAALGDIRLGNDAALSFTASETISYGPVLRVRARAVDGSALFTLQDSGGNNRAVLQADFANSRTNLDYRNSSGVQQQLVTVDATDGMRVHLGANAGRVITTGNLDLTAYGSTDPSNLSFPVGETIIVNRTINTARNAPVNPCLSTATTGQYEQLGSPNAGSALAGNWRARGRIGTNEFLAKRVS